MNSGRPSGRRPAQGNGRPPQRNNGGRPPVRPAQNGARRPAAPADRERQRRDMNEALNERYEEMVAPSRRVDDINRGKYADLSTFESKGHRKIDPAVMRAKRQQELIRKSIPVAVVALIAVIVLWIYLGAVLPASRYEDAVAFFNEEDYSSAEKLFDKINGYKDTGKYSAYIDAMNAYKKGDYSTAKSIFEDLEDFHNSREMASQADYAMMSAAEDGDKAKLYSQAEALLAKGDYEGARDVFGSLGDYKDSADRAYAASREADYLEAKRLIAAGDEETARQILSSLGDYKDSAALLSGLGGEQMSPEQTYNEAKRAFDEGDYRNANLLFYSLGNYKDSKAYTDYTYADMCLKNGDYSTAITCFDACGSFLDAEDRSRDARYRYACYLNNMQDETLLPQIIDLFEGLGSYADSAEMLYGAKEQYRGVAAMAYAAGDLQKALDIYVYLGDHPGCAAEADRIRSEMAGA